MHLRAELRIDPQTQRLLTQGGEVVHQAIVAGMDLTVQAVEAVVAERTPVDQGTLRASIYGRVVDQWPRIDGVVGSPLVYAEPVELGSRPHWPPPSAIQGWVHRKFGLAGREMVRVAFLVARAISRRGTRGHFMFRQGLQYGERVGPQLIGQLVARAEREVSDR